MKTKASIQACSRSWCHFLAAWPGRPALVKAGYRSLLLVMPALALTGCITPGHVPVKTSGYGGQALREVVLVRDALEPSGSVEISKRAQGYQPMIYESDRVHARRQALKLSKALRDHIDQRFSEDAAAQGLKVVPASAETLTQTPTAWPRLALQVQQAHFVCEVGCLMYFWVQVQLHGAGSAGDDAAPLWSGRIRIGQRLSDTEPTDTMYQDLLKQLFAAMRKDGVL